MFAINFSDVILFFGLLALGCVGLGLLFIFFGAIVHLLAGWLDY